MALGTVPAPARVCIHKPTVASELQAIDRISAGVSGLWAAWTSVATTFFVFVNGTTAPGSVDRLYRVAMAASFSLGSRRIKLEMRNSSIVLFARMFFPEDCEERFCRDRSDHSLAMGASAFPPTIKVSTIPGNLTMVS